MITAPGRWIGVGLLWLATAMNGNVAIAGSVKYEIDDATELSKIISTNDDMNTLATINSWIEGPTWLPTMDGGCFIFSAMGENKVMKWTQSGGVETFLQPPPMTKYNGNTTDLDGRLVSCQAGRAGLKVVLTGADGKVTPLATNYEGRPFNSPNDLAVKSDGSVWFTDPDYDSGENNQPGHYVYRFYETNANATVTAVITNMTEPNGICFSPDEKRLYVCDTGANPNYVRVFNVTPDNGLDEGRVFCVTPVPDGIRCDAAGRLWIGAKRGLEIYAPDGHLIGRALVGRVTNVCFGGADYRTLFMVGQPYVRSLPVLVRGASWLRAARFISLDLIDQVPAGSPVQASVTARYPDTSRDVTFDPGTTYESSKPEVATVDGSGRIFGVSPGKTVITASFGGEQDNRVVTVFKSGH